MQELKRKPNESSLFIQVHMPTHIQSENIKKLAGGIVVASTGLKKWFKEKWVDIGRPKKKGKYQEHGKHIPFRVAKEKSNNTYPVGTRNKRY